MASITIKTGDIPQYSADYIGMATLKLVKQVLKDPRICAVLEERCKK